MQEEKLVLPKFVVPGQRNWVPWALAGVGGLVVMSALAFSVVLMKNKNQPVAATPAIERVAEAPAAPAAPVPAAPAKTALAAVATPPADIAKEEAPAKPAKAHRSHHARGSKTLARAGGSTHARSSGKPDALDELLKKFK